MSTSSDEQQPTEINNATIELLEQILSKISKFKTSNQEVKPKIEVVTKPEIQQLQPNQQKILKNKTIKQIYEAVNQKWKSLGSKPFRVLASFVLTSNDSTNPEVLAIATGSKCVPAERLVLDGSVVHDSHAEIIARRALKLVLYDHLKHLTKSIGPIVMRKS
ncbi:hypothetical protein BLOT_010466 [Blomia tropicalis]|nr:hypothetical protein BLOT_010466 [Blomia tropicalis]